jgi:hypothetical protein
MNIGSRNSQTYFYWDDNKIQVVCGCFKGNLSEFKNAVNKKHSGNEHEKKYISQINIVCMILSSNGINLKDIENG